MYDVIIQKLDNIDRLLTKYNKERGGTKQMQDNNKTLATEIITDLKKQNIILKIAVGMLTAGLILAIIF